MELTTTDDLIECVDDIIDFLTEHEDVYYLALDVAHQLRDETLRATADEQDYTE